MALLDALMPKAPTVLGHKHGTLFKALQLPPLSRLAPLPFQVALLFGLWYNTMSQGMSSVLSLIKGPEIEGGSTQWGEFCPRKGLMKVIGTHKVLLHSFFHGLLQDTVPFGAHYIAHV